MWRRTIEFWKWDCQLYRWVGNPKWKQIYSVEDEQDESDTEDDGVADKGLAREAGDWSTFAYFEYNQCKSKSLNCTCKSEDEGELAIAEYEVEEENDRYQDGPVNCVFSFDVLHVIITWLYLVISILRV